MDTIYKTSCANAARTQSVMNRIRRIFTKIASLMEFDAEPIAKSKDWPYLWSKNISGSTRDRAEKEC